MMLKQLQARVALRRRRKSHAKAAIQTNPTEGRYKYLSAKTFGPTPLTFMTGNKGRKMNAKPKEISGAFWRSRKTAATREPRTATKRMGSGVTAIVGVNE